MTWTLSDIISGYETHNKTGYNTQTFNAQPRTVSEWQIKNYSNCKGSDKLQEFMFCRHSLVFGCIFANEQQPQKSEVYAYGLAVEWMQQENNVYTRVFQQNVRDTQKREKIFMQ